MKTEGHLDWGRGTHARFPTKTLWTRIIAARGGSSPGAQAALNHLCQTYWFPVYAFIRGKGHDSHAAKDLTQSFFVHLLQHQLIDKADQALGRFRSYICKACVNFLADQRRRERAVKRGGAAGALSIDEMVAEENYARLPASKPAPEKLFDRAWAATTIEQATRQLRHSYEKQGKLALYEILKRCTSGELTSDSYPQLAAKLGMSKATFEVNLSRFKDRFAAAVREVIGQTVDPKEISHEIKYLMSAWASHLEDTKRGTTKLA